MTLGKKGITGDNASEDTFNGMADLAISKHGDIFVADGEGPNSRVVKFSKEGKFIKWWGGKGTDPGQFDVPHSIALDAKGHVYVADRSNNRIQIFDQDGHFIAEWKQFGRPSGIYIDKNDVLYVADSESREGEPGYGYNPGCRRGIRIGSAKDGSVKYFVPDPVPYPPAADSTGPEGVTADPAGTFYGAEFTMDVKKYVRK
jgi:DNA-binding beta-propeller fold protein YncE